MNVSGKLTSVPLLPLPPQALSKKIKRKQKIIGKESNMRRRVWKLNERKVREQFKARVGEWVNVIAPDLWKCWSEGMLKACD